MPDKPEDRDAVEVWATRIGRGFGVIFVIVLASYLLATYWPR